MRLANFNFTLYNDKGTNIAAAAVSSWAFSTNIKNITVDNINIVANGTDCNSGGLAGSTDGCTIANCTISGNISGNWTGYAGGAVGSASFSSRLYALDTNVNISSDNTAQSNA